MSRSDEDTPLRPAVFTRVGETAATALVEGLTAAASEPATRAVRA